MEDKLEQYLTAKKAYEDKLEEANREIYKLEGEKKQIMDSLQKQFNTTDLTAIETQLSTAQDEITKLEEELASLGE
jgi:predicted  nucleic acid-binding Zn-ribbon protein